MPARKGARDLQLVEREPISITIALVAADGERWSLPVALRPFSLRDEAWLVKRQEGTDWTDQVLDGNNSQILVDMFAHQLIDADREQLAARLELSDTDWAAVAAALMDRIAADPHQEPPPIKTLLAAVLEARSASWPAALLDEPGDKGKKKAARWRPKTWTVWLCGFAFGCVCSWMISWAGLPDVWSKLTGG